MLYTTFMGFFKNILITNIAIDAAARVTGKIKDSTPIGGAISYGLNKLTGSIDAKHLKKIEKTIDKLKEPYIMYTTPPEQKRSTDFFFETKKTTYHYQIFDTQGTELYTATNKDCVLTIEKGNSSPSAKVVLHEKKLEKLQSFNISSPGLQDTVIHKCPNADSSDIYEFKTTEWKMIYNSFLKEAVLMDGYSDNLATIKYVSGGLVVGFNKKDKGLYILIAAFLPLIELSREYYATS